MDRDGDLPLEHPARAEARAEVDHGPELEHPPRQGRVLVLQPPELEVERGVHQGLPRRIRPPLGSRSLLRARRLLRLGGRPRGAPLRDQSRRQLGHRLAEGVAVLGVHARHEGRELQEVALRPAAEALEYAPAEVRRERRHVGPVAVAGQRARALVLLAPAAYLHPVVPEHVLEPEPRADLAEVHPLAGVVCIRHYGPFGLWFMSCLRPPFNHARVVVTKPLRPARRPPPYLALHLRPRGRPPLPRAPQYPRRPSESPPPRRIGAAAKRLRHPPALEHPRHHLAVAEAGELVRHVAEHASQGLRVLRPHAERDDRPDVREHRVADARPERTQPLARERHGDAELAGLREHRGERVGREGVELVDVDREVAAAPGRQVEARHGREVELGEEQRAEYPRLVLAEPPLRQARDEDPAPVHGAARVHPRPDLTEDVPQ